MSLEMTIVFGHELDVGDTRISIRNIYRTCQTLSIEKCNSLIGGNTFNNKLNATRSRSLSFDGNIDIYDTQQN